MTSLGDRLREERERQKLSMAELGRRVGMTGAGIGQIESGVTKSPVPENLHKLCDELGLNPRWLVTEDKPKYLTAGPKHLWDVDTPGQAKGLGPNIIEGIAKDYKTGKLTDEDLLAIGDFACYRKTRKE